MNRTLWLMLVLIFGCFSEDNDLQERITHYSENCKSIPENWILLSKVSKIKWIKERKPICKPSVPFLLDVVKIYSNRNRDNWDNKKLVYRNIVRLHLSREQFILMSKELNQIKKDCKNKESELDLYFILRTLFKDSATLRVIENLIFDF